MEKAPAETANVRRFEAAADPNAKREFAQKLVAALEEIAVGPGQRFVVTTSSFIGELEKEARNMATERDEATAEKEDAEEAVESIQEIVEDFRRGILDKEEMLQKVREFATSYV